MMMVVITVITRKAFSGVHTYPTDLDLSPRPLFGDNRTLIGARKLFTNIYSYISIYIPTPVKT